MHEAQHNSKKHLNAQRQLYPVNSYAFIFVNFAMI